VKIIRNILMYVSNKMHILQNLFYLTIALHVSGVTLTHLQEHKRTVTTASGNRYTVLLSAAIVEELELNQCLPKHVVQLKNIEIINYTTRWHLFGSFCEIYITMHGSMNIRLIEHQCPIQDLNPHHLLNSG
jgi:hypothetical protein